MGILLAVLLSSYALAINFEVGYEVDVNKGSAGYIYVSEDFRVAELPFNTYLWFSPSAEIEFRSPLEGFVQAQFLVDAAPATLSVRGKYEFDGTLTFRAGVLFEF
jgi:hypothetical protein